MPSTTLSLSMETAIRPLFTSTTSSLPPPRTDCHSLLYTLQRIAVLVILAPLESCPVLLPFSSYSLVSRYRRRQIAICSPSDRPLLADARIRSLINTPGKAAQCLSPIPFPASVAATAGLAMSLRQLVRLALFVRRRQWVQASIRWPMLAF